MRFDRNIVDTICEKGLGWSFAIMALLSCLLWLLYLSGSKWIFSGIYFDVLAFLCVAYLVYYVGRLWYFTRMRRHLRADPHPIVCESYGIVIYDDRGFGRPSSTLKSAILYKETGSLKPRFFTGPTRRGYRYEFQAEVIVKVFPDRNDPRLYSVDDGMAYGTASEKRSWFGRLAQRSLGGAESCGDEAKKPYLGKEE